jgi:hypothetical protein
MSLEINDVGELEKLLRKLDLKVHDLDELKSLLATLQRPKDPDQVRLETIRHIGVTVPCTAAGVAMGATFTLLFFGGILDPSAIVGGLGAIWGSVAVMSVPAVLAAMWLLRVPPAPSSGGPATPPNTSRRVAEDLSEFVIARKEP